MAAASRIVRAQNHRSYYGGRAPVQTDGGYDCDGGIDIHEIPGKIGQRGGTGKSEVFEYGADEIGYPGEDVEIFQQHH